MSKRISHMKNTEKELVKKALEECAHKLTAPDLIDHLLTESEKLTIGRRVVIAQMILSGYNQAEINEVLNVSPNTFARTRKWLDGEIPQFDQAIKEYRQAHVEKSKKKQLSERKLYNPTTFTGLRNRYPMHFLFFNLAEEIMKKLYR